MGKEKPFNVFISYEWELIDQIIKLYNVISSEITNKLWLDKLQIKSKRIQFEDLKNGMDNSDSVICCITKAYSQSQYCQDVLGYSIYCNKKILILMFENLDLTNDVGWVGSEIINYPRCDIFKCPDVFEKKCGPVYDECMTLINSLIGVYKIVKTQDDQDDQIILNQSIDENKKAYNINRNYLFENKTCGVCNLTKNCLNLWNANYCDSCWIKLSCSECKILIDKSKVYKLDDDKIICESCVLIDEIKSFDLSNLIPDTKKINFKICKLCKQQEPFPYELFSEYYCQNCWTLLDCSSCKNQIDKKRVFKSIKNEKVLCKLCYLKETEKRKDLKPHQIIPFDISKRQDAKEQSKYYFCNNCKAGSKLGLWLWSFFYCQNCWLSLDCRGCHSLLTPQVQTFRGKDDQPYCQDCIINERDEPVIKTKHGDYNRFDISSIAVLCEAGIQNCNICKQKTSSSYRLWNFYYCKNKCWNLLYCKRCKIIIDKTRVYKGKRDNLICKDCAKSDRMEIIKEENEGIQVVPTNMSVTNTSSSIGKTCFII